MDYEQKYKSSTTIETNDLFDYDVDDLSLLHNQFMLAQKYLITTAKGYLNFQHLIKATPKMRFIEFLYRAPNQIIHKCLELIDKNYDDLESELKDLIITKQPEIDVKEVESKISHFIFDFATGLIPSIYNAVSDIVIDQHSIHDFVSYSVDKTVTSKIQATLFKSTYGNVDELSKTCRTLYKDHFNYLTGPIIRKIIRKFVIDNQHLSETEIQKLTTGIFKPIEAKRLLVQTYKSRITEIEENID